jgi:hypothetical protein
MTGQVKEEILTRWGELGLRVTDGTITFDTALLRDGEFLTGDGTFSYIDTTGTTRSLDLRAGSLAFTFCQTPVVYLRGGEAAIQVRYRDGCDEDISGSTLSADVTARVFSRDSTVERIEVTLPA